MPFLSHPHYGPWIVLPTHSIPKVSLQPAFSGFLKMTRIYYFQEVKQTCSWAAYRSLTAENPLVLCSVSSFHRRLYIRKVDEPLKSEANAEVLLSMHYLLCQARADTRGWKYWQIVQVSVRTLPLFSLNLLPQKTSFYWISAPTR